MCYRAGLDAIEKRKHPASAGNGTPIPGPSNTYSVVMKMNLPGFLIISTRLLRCQECSVISFRLSRLCCSKGLNESESSLLTFSHHTTEMY